MKVCTARKKLVIRGLLFLLLLGGGVAGRIVYAAHDPLMDRDSVLYCEIADKWHRSGDIDIALESRVGNTNPGYIFLLKKGIDWGFPVILWGRGISLAASVVFFLAMYGIGRCVFPRCGGEVLLLIAALHPVAGQLAMTLLRDPVCLALYAVCFLAVLQVCCNPERWWWTALFAVSGACAFFLRYEALELLSVFFLLTWFSLREGKDWRVLRRAWLHCVFWYMTVGGLLMWSMGLSWGKMLMAPGKKFEAIVSCVRWWACIF